MRFAKLVFRVAAIYGLIALLPQYFLEAKTGRDFPPAITHPEFYYGFIGLAVVFQIVFLIISRDPVRYRTMMIPSVLEKATWFIAALVLFLQSRLAATILGFAIIDMCLGILFVIAFVKTPSKSV